MEFKHPKYYKEMRAQKRKLQAASLKQAIQETVPHNDIEEAQASSDKPQAEESSKPQASSPKHKASSSKPQATSSMIRDPRNIW